MTEWQNDRLTEWPSDRVTKWPSKVTEWPSDWVTEWPSDRVTEWPCDRVIKLLPILPMLLIELEWDFYIGSSIFLEFLLMANSKVFYLHHRKSNHNSWRYPDNCKCWQRRQWWWCPWSLERLSTEQLHKYVGSSRRSSEGSSHVHDVLFGCRHTLHQMWRRR